MFTLDSVIPRFPLTCIARNDKDLAICCPTGIYIIEDYGLTSMKRRFFPLEQEFRAILYTSGNSVNLICLSADGRLIWSFDCIDGILKLVHQSSSLNEKFTSIQMASETELLIGTFNGEIITKPLNSSLLLDTPPRKYSEYPILSISSDSCHFIDSQGKLFSNEKIIFDDGILQPCRLLKSLKYLFLLKHDSVYIFDSKTDEFIKKLTSDDFISAAELDKNDNLIICTDRGRLLTLEGLKLKDFNFKHSIETHESESETEEEDFEDFDQEVSDKLERIFGLIRNPNANEILVLKVDNVHKRAWLEEIAIHGDDDHSPSTYIKDVQTTVAVICPLCDESVHQQTLPINGSTCLKGHPITICAQSKHLITTKCYKCRDCNCAFTKNPQSCPFCRGLITK